MLLLDAVNEMPHAGEADYRERVALWKVFLADLARRAPGTRAVFSCRSLDYSAPLSTPELPVPHVRIERLADEQVEEFLALWSPEQGPSLWRQLRGTPQLDLFRSPFYLKLLLAQTDGDGAPPAGRAALFTGFVRQALAREVENDNRLFRPGPLLQARDHEQIVRREWRDPYDLPARGRLVPALSDLAFGLQERRGAGEVSRVRAREDEALALLGGEHAEDLLRAAVDLQALEVQWDDVFFAHQLLQEYFAARAVAETPRPELGAHGLALPRTCRRASTRFSGPSRTPIRCPRPPPPAGRRRSCSPRRWCATPTHSWPPWPTRTFPSRVAAPPSPR